MQILLIKHFFSSSGNIFKMIQLINNSKKLSWKFFRMYSSSNLGTDELIFKKINHVGCITLNRPKQLNAINFLMIYNLKKNIR